MTLFIQKPHNDTGKDNKVSTLISLKEATGVYIRSGAVRQPVRFKHLRGMERPVTPHLTRLSSDRGHNTNRVQNLALK